MLKKFRMLKVVLVCTLIMTLFMPMVGLADGMLETKEPTNKLRMLNSNIDRSIVKPDREMVERFLTIVEKYSPETLDDWEYLAEERKDLLDDIHEVRANIRALRGEKIGEKKENRRELVERIRGNHKDARNELVVELSQKVRNGEMTREEARAQLKEYVENNKEMAEAKKDEYKDIVEKWKEEKKVELAEWKAEHQEEIDKIKSKREIILGLRTELKKAVDGDDAEAVNEILEQLYPEIQQANDFLAKRVEWLQEKYDRISTMEDVVISDEL